LPSTEKVLAMARKMNARGKGTVIGAPLKLLPTYAALINGCSSHSLSLDDIYTPASLHPGAPVFAASLAAAELIGEGGKRFVEGIVAGYETSIRIAEAVDTKSHYALGWHPSATCGTFGAAVAVGHILGLDLDKTVCALGIAGSKASGLMAFLQNGTWTKRLHAGLAAQGGLEAALLAAEGFKGPNAVLEGPWGFLGATSRSSDRSLLTKNFDKKWKIMETSLKLHACCRYNQSAIDAAIKIMDENNLNPGSVDQVQVELFGAAFPLVVEPWEEKLNPQTDVQAQFSLPYAVALAIVKGRVSFDEFQPEILNDRKIRNMMKKICVVHNAEFDGIFPKKWPSRITIHTVDGRVLECRVDYPRGDVENPLSWEELVRRFKTHSAAVFKPSRQEIILQKVKTLSTILDLNELTLLLAI